MTDHAELIEQLTGFAGEQDTKAGDCLSRPYRAAFRNKAKLIREAATAIAAMPPALSPELIDKLSKLATYLTEQGEYEACDLIDTVVERLTPPPGAKP